MPAQGSPISVVPERLLEVSKYPDVFQALLRNVPLVAEDIREHYLPQTDSLAGSLKESLLKETGISSVSRPVRDILEGLAGGTVAALDGGQGFGILGGTVPFMLRTVTYSVTLGSRSPDRERIRTDPLFMNRLAGGALGLSGSGKDLLGAILLLVEITNSLKSVRTEPPDIFLLHGPLVRSLPQYATYVFSPRDLETVMGTSLYQEFQAWFEGEAKPREVKVRFPGQARTVRAVPDSGRLSQATNFIYPICFVLESLFEEARKSNILLAGVVERTSSTEILQQVLFSDFADFSRKKSAWMRQVVGRAPPPGLTPAGLARYIKEFADNLGYFDALLLGTVLNEGEYLHPREARANRPQIENRAIGLDTGFIRGQEGLSGLVPRSCYTYVRTSSFNSPFRIEMPLFLKAKARERLIEAIHAFSQFLPRYAFPVNLDVVDKLAKIPQWLTDIYVSMITKEIYEGVAGEPGTSGSWPALLLGKTRDWYLRPKAAKWVA